MGALVVGAVSIVGSLAVWLGIKKQQTLQDEIELQDNQTFWGGLGNSWKSILALGVVGITAILIKKEFFDKGFKK